MAELILTEEEKAQSFADADELALGKACKAIAFKIGLGDCVDSFLPPALTVATQAFIFACIQSGADNLKLTQEYSQGPAEGNWEFVCRKID
jgi:hypothetical protein